MPRDLNDALVGADIKTSSRSVLVDVAVDVSTSTAGLKNKIINQSMREGVNALKDQAQQHAEIPHHFSCITFADDAKRPFGETPLLMEDVVWNDVPAGGMTATGKAIHLQADMLDPAKMPKKTYPAVLVLISDGANTDGNAYEEAIARLENNPYGKRAVRVAIGVGPDYDREQLAKFTNLECGVLEAANTVDLVNYIKYALTTVVQGSITPPSYIPGKSINSFIPPPPAKGTPNGITMEVF